MSPRTRRSWVPSCLLVAIASDERARHVLRPYPFIELLRRDDAELQGRVTEGEILAVRFQRDLCGFLVADVRVECRHEHERVVQVLANALLVRRDAVDAAVAERMRSVRQELNR